MTALRFPTCFLFAMLALLCTHGVVRADELPGDSLYHLDVALVDQNGRGLHLAERRGKPVLISMFYTSCQYVCPLIIDTLRKTQRTLAENGAANVDVLLVSFDPERDTPVRLHQVFAERKLDANWTLARTDAPSVRKLAAVLDIQYRALANGDVNHSSAITLLDANGRIVARTDKIGEVDAEFVAKARAAH
jgi:protein SCO1/2